MKKIFFKTIVSLIAAAGFAFGAIDVSAAEVTEEAAAVVIKDGVSTPYTSGKMTDAWNDASNAGKGAVLKLMDDWKPGSVMTVSSGKYLTLDLNGHIIDRDLRRYESKGSLFTVESDAVLRITDSSPKAEHKGYAVKGGILTGGKSSDTAGCIDMKKGSTVSISGCSIVSCATKQDGGAIRMNGVCELTAEGTGFCSNYTMDSNIRCYGGAIYVGDGTAFIRGCAFDGNYCEDHGGAIYMNDGELQVESTLFRGNRSAKEGGAIYCNGTHNDSMVQSSTFAANSADGNGGAVFVSDCKQLVFYNSVFSHNSSKKNGGAVYVNCDKVVLANTTVTGNKAELNGGGIYVDSLHDIGVQGKVIVRNNTNSTGKNNNLCLQSGVVSTAYITNGGLYEGSMIYLTSTTKDRILAAKEISKYQSMRYIRADNGNAVIDEKSTKQVEEKFVASLIGDGHIIVIGGGLALVTVCIVFGVIRKNKVRRKEES